jgi:signal peptidase I
MTFKDLLYFMLAVIVIVPIRLFIAQPFIVSGDSMLPTFETGQYLIVDQVSYRVGDPDRGDVVIFRYPNDETKFFIKRVIGLPGERIVVEDSRVTVYGDEHPEGYTLEEPYIYYTRSDMIDVTLEDDEYFVLGDNRFSSSDSRIWGPLKADLIVGRAYARLYPLSKLDYLPGFEKLEQ